jgi:hypothetical protein
LAFYISGLRSVSIGSKVDSIGNQAFGGTDLSSINIPSSVTLIDYNAFSYCKNLTTVRFYGNAPTIMGNVFYGCSPELKLYYLEGASGFPIPGYESYPTEIFTLPQLSPPTDLNWDTSGSGIATWVGVENATGYSVQLLKDGIPEGSPVLAEAETEYFDFSSLIPAAGYGVYSFVVTAIGDGINYANSEASKPSPLYHYTGVPRISPETAVFDKNDLAQADIVINMTLNANTLINISNGTTSLSQEIDYLTSGDTVTIKKEYLALQDVGTLNLLFKFSDGSTQTLTITISDSSPVPYIIGDVDGDGLVDVADAILILQKVAGLIDKFPIEP